MRRTPAALLVVLSILATLPARADDYTTSQRNRFPTANPGTSPRAVQPGTPATFDARNSTDLDGSVASATWDLGDGTIAHGFIVEHAYARAGAYVAHLTVRDDLGAIGSAPLMVLVGDQPAILTEDVMIPVTAGYNVHAQIRRPNDAARHPVVMRYSLYCTSFNLSDEALVRSGYVFIHAEAPGLCGSGGGFDLFGPEVARAGHDAIEWTATQTWSDGNVGLVGHSGPAITGLAAARARPPHLRTAVFGTPFIDAYRDAVYPGGALSMVAPEYDAVVAAEPRPGAQPGPRAQGWLDWQQDILAHPTDDAFWHARALAADYAALDIPVYLMSSWSDLFARGSLEFFHYRANPASRLAMFPGPHWSFDPTGTMGYRGTRDQDIHVGSEERVWLDRYLRGIGGADARAPGAFFIQDGGGSAAQAFARGAWRTADTWPLPNTDWQHWRFTPSVDQSILRGNDGVTDPRWVDFWAAAGHRAQDGRGFVDAPDDITTGVAFTTPPMDAPITIAGPITATITAAVPSSDAVFHATLLDVWPDGSAHVLTSGALRASMRAIDDARSWHNAAGEITRVWHAHDRFESASAEAPPQDYAIEIWPTANTFARGHQMQLRLSLARAPWSAPDASAPVAFLARGDVLLPVVR